MLAPFIFVLEQLKRQDAGATTVEYAMMLLLIGLLCLAAISALGNGVVAFYLGALIPTFNDATAAVN